MNEKEINETFFAEGVWVHYDEIAKFIYTLTLDKYLTDDLIQETMFCCWRKLETIKKYNDVKAALMKIARNQFNQEMRKKKRKKEDLCNPETMDQFAFACASNIEEFIKKEGDVHECLLIFSGIKKEYVRIVILADYYGFSLKEIDAMLKQNYNTVVTYHVRGLQEMRKKKKWYDKLHKGENDDDKK